MQYEATAKYVHMSPRKVGLLVDGLRGMAAVKALAALSVMPQKATKPLVDILKSAIANAKQKNAAIESLTISEFTVTGGPVLKRWHAASRGMAHPYKKRMSHVHVVVSENEKAEKVVVAKEVKKEQTA
jgi:large subunit ribosomal protein L22